MFRISPADFDDAVGALSTVCDGADNIAYRTDLLLADFRPLAEGEFADASAERGAEVGLKAKLLSLSLFALLETLRAGREKLDLVVSTRAELDAVAGKGVVEPTDPALDALVNVSDSASALDASALDVTAALEEAAVLLEEVDWKGDLTEQLSQAADSAARQVAYGQSALSAYDSYAAAVGDFEDALVPWLDPETFLQEEAAGKWAGGEIAEGSGIGSWLGAVGDAAGAVGDPLGGVAAVLSGFGIAVRGNEVALVRAYTAAKGIGADGAELLSRALSSEGISDEVCEALGESIRKHGDDLVAALGDIEWIKFGVDEEVAETIVSRASRVVSDWSSDAKKLDELADAARATGEKMGKHAGRLGWVAGVADVLLAAADAGPVAPEMAASAATETAVVVGSGTVGGLATSGLGGLLGGLAVAGGGATAFAGGVAWGLFKDTPEGEDFQREVDLLFMGAAGFGSARPNDYFGEAEKREQLAAAGDGKGR